MVKKETHMNFTTVGSVSLQDWWCLMQGLPANVQYCQFDSEYSSAFTRSEEEGTDGL